MNHRRHVRVFDLLATWPPLNVDFPEVADAAPEPRGFEERNFRDTNKLLIRKRWLEGSNPSLFARVSARGTGWRPI